MSLSLNRLYLGDCVEVMAGFPENSVDVAVTDPPYGLGFMGKDWDKALPPREAFEQMFRVLKPGGLAFVMSSPRQDLLWRMLAMLEGVGFELNQSYIDWIFKSGFPKAYDVSKGIDKKFGRLNYSIIEIKNKLKRLYKKSGKSYKQIDDECGFTASKYIIIDKKGKRPDPWTYNLPTYEKWLKIKEVIGYTICDLDELFREEERDIQEVIKKKAGWFTNQNEYSETAPATILSTKWDGWKSQTGLKPAVEMIIQAQKPFGEHQPIFLLVVNLLISLNKDEADWLKLVALTVDKSSMSNLHTSNEDGANSVHSIVRTNINIKKFTANNVEKYLQWSNHPNSNSVPINVPLPIIQALVTRLGREVGSSEAMDISQCMSEIGNTASNTILLWKNILVALLLKLSNATTRTVSATITELKILNSVLCPSTSLHITKLKEIFQNGQRFNASTVENCFKGVFSKLKDIPIYSVQGNALENTEIQNLSVNNVEKHSPSSTSMRILESIAHGPAIIKHVPAHEPILMVRKPLSESTIVDNVLKWGTGAINVDGCRIPVNLDVDDLLREVSRKPRITQTWETGSGFKNEANHITGVPASGRFPANLLVSDRALDTGKLSKSGEFKPHHKISQDDKGYAVRSVYGKYRHVSAENQVFHGDVGDQSRYFDLDAWAKHHGFLDVPKPDGSERNFGLSNVGAVYEVVESEVTVSVCSVCGKLDASVAPLDPCRCEAPLWVDEKRLVRVRRRKPHNVHPTVKPVKLMAYLVTLGCPPGGVVLDPFMGSGTTCVSAKMLGRAFIGIELKAEYYDIARARVNAVPSPLKDMGATK